MASAQSPEADAGGARSKTESGHSLPERVARPPRTPPRRRGPPRTPKRTCLSVGSLFCTVLLCSACLRNHVETEAAAFVWAVDADAEEGGRCDCSGLPALPQAVKHPANSHRFCCSPGLVFIGRLQARVPEGRTWLCFRQEGRAILHFKRLRCGCPTEQMKKAAVSVIERWYARWGSFPTRFRLGTACGSCSALPVMD